MQTLGDTPITIIKPNFNKFLGKTSKSNQAIYRKHFCQNQRSRDAPGNTHS